MKTKKINIPLSDQVVDLETARELNEKLKSAGIEIRSALHWYKMPDDMYNVFLPREERFLHIDAVQICPAPTLPEILAVLPCYIEILGEIFFRAIYGNHLICYESGDTKARLTNQKGKIDDNTNPATAAAKLLIWCIDNGYIKGVGE